MIEGRILTLESMGLVDGPGIRTVVFFKGCPLRCMFCHNPDSWCGDKGETVNPESLMKKILRFRPYFERSGGGVTFSGGEPLMQPDFLLEMLKRCRTEGIHTCLDTSGVGLGRYEEILGECDLVLYDVKATGNESYQKLCKATIEETQRFTEVLKRLKTPTIVRQVVVPGLNDTDDYMISLKKYVETHIPHTKAVELLPYHRMGEHKYKALDMAVPLGDTPPMDKKKTELFWEKHFSKDFE